MTKSAENHAGVKTRVDSLRGQVMRRHGSFPANLHPFTRDVALWRATHQTRSIIQTRAALLHELVKVAPIEFPPGWALAGEHLIAGQSPTFGFVQNCQPDPAVLQDLGVAADDIPYIRQAVE